MQENSFFKKVIKDGDEIFSGISVDPTAISLPEDYKLNEFQYYIHKVGFYLVHTLAWCRQLDFAVEFLTNFDYKKRINASRADHLTFNIENYLIRVNSIYDRVLQIVNAVFHLCINEEHVSHSVIISNYKVAHRPEICSKIKAIRKFVNDYSETRHTLIHKHSYQDVDLRKIQFMYFSEPKDWAKTPSEVKKIKRVRARFLTDYIRDKRKEFIGINVKLRKLLDKLLNSLEKEYERQKKLLM